MLCVFFVFFYIFEIDNFCFVVAIYGWYAMYIQQYLIIIFEMWEMPGQLQIAFSWASFIYQKRFKDDVSRLHRPYIVSIPCTWSQKARTKQKEKNVFKFTTKPTKVKKKVVVLYFVKRESIFFQSFSGLVF